MAIEMQPGKPAKLPKGGVHLVRAIATATPALFVSDPATLAGLASNTLPALIDAALSLRKGGGPLSASAWDVTRAAYACGLARFMAKVDLKRRPQGPELEEFIRHLVVRAGMLAEQAPQALALDHLLSPLRIGVLREAARSLPHELKEFGPTVPPGQLRRLFESSLFEGLQDVRNGAPETFQAIEHALTSPLSMSSERRAAAVRHNEYLIRAFAQQPVFGQEETGITLSDLYVRQRCIWNGVATKPQKSRRTKDDAHSTLTSSEFSPDKEGAHVPCPVFVADLHETVMNWLGSSDPRDCVRVIAGGPGSGKSTFAKALSVALIDSDTYDLLYVPLQDIEASGSLDTRIAHLFRSRTELGFDRTDSPLNWMGDRQSDGRPPIKPLLLVCDGLDEIAAPGSAEAQTVTTDFIQVLSTWLAHRNSGGLFARALILGRTIAAETAFAKLAIDAPALLRVAGLLPVATSPEWRVAKERGVAHDPSSVAEVDQRVTYWRQWCAATDVAATGLPEALKANHAPAHAIQELTAEPLLLYLLLWTGFIGARWKEAASNRNVVYEEIFRRIYKRDWGSQPYPGRNRDAGGHAGTRHLVEDEFALLQEALGLASWSTGGRTATAQSFEVMLRAHVGEELLEDIGRDTALSLRSVALQTYTRSSDIESGGFEFVHKTLGEYLIARALVRTGRCATSKLRGRVSESRCRAAAQELARIAQGGPLTIEIFRFFDDEISSFAIKQLRETLLRQSLLRC